VHVTRKIKLGLIMAVGVVFAAAIVLFLFTFTVRFTDVAVLTRFGKATREYDGAERPGLKFKWPYPVDSVTKYDTRFRLVQLRKEAQQTADNRQVIVEAFCTWRVTDPRLFFERFSSEGDRAESQYEAATETIRARLRTAVGEISRYRIDELFRVEDLEGDHPRLAELEDEILVALNTPNDAGETIQQLNGVEISMVGISSIVLPQETSKAVFDRMKQDRRTLVQEISSQAEAEAQAIVSAAETDRDKIEAFALERAQEWRALGDQEAQQYLQQMGEHEQLAVFLEQIEFIRNMLAGKATLVFSTDSMGLELLDPEVMTKTPRGEVPGAEQFIRRAGTDGAEPDSLSEEELESGAGAGELGEDPSRADAGGGR
jgi:membrane protease subunit HflC